MNFKIVSWIKLLPFLIVFGCGSAESVSNGDALGSADISEGMNEDESVSPNEPVYDWRDLRDFLADYAGALCDGIKDCCPDTTSYQQCMAGPNYMSRSMFPKDYVDLDGVADDVIQNDGLGHVLSGYDGVENIVEIDGVDYHIYRTN